jgi:TATA-binding protein-associated factor Taf7
MGNIVNRVFDSSGPEGKVRGTPQQIIDKYNQLARDAQLSNDRVAFENFQQHAEHYTRMLGEALREQEQFRQQQEGGRQGDDRDFGQRDQQPRDQRQDERDQRQDERGERQDRGDRPDRERGERDRNDRDRTEDRFEPPRFLQARTDDVIDVAEDEDRGGLVETPEAASAAPADEAPRPPRRRRARKGGGEGGEGQSEVKPEAAE